jgi:hypothetical protein
MDPVIRQAMIKQRCTSALRSPVGPLSLFGDEFIQLKLGTAVELRCIIIDKIVTWIGNTNVAYSIDGVRQDTAARTPTNASDYLYNQSLFRVGGLANTEHTLRVDLLKPSILMVCGLHFFCHPCT